MFEPTDSKFHKMDIIIISIKGHNVSYLSVISLCFKSRKLM